FADPQAVSAEDAATPFRLRFPVLLHVAPPAHRLLVAPERERHEARGVVDALETLDGDEAVELAHFLAEPLGELLVVAEASFGGGELEDHCNHAASSQGIMR